MPMRVTGAPPVPHAPETPHAPDATVDPAVEARVQELLKRPYRLVIQADPDSGYVATAPDLENCLGAGDTPEAALVELRDAMASWLLVAIEHGEPIPDPTPPPETAYSGKFVLRVPKSIHRQLAERAEAEGTSLNQTALALLAQGLGRTTT